VEVEEECAPRETKDCISHPLDKNWKKLCFVSPSTSNSLDFHTEEERGEGRGRSLEDLLSSSVSSPVTDLVVETLSKIKIQDLGEYSNPVVVIRRTGHGEAVAEMGEGVHQREEERDLERELEREVELDLVKSLQNQQEKAININMNVKYDFATPPTQEASISASTIRSSTIPSFPSQTSSSVSSLVPSPNSVYFDQLLLTHLQDLKDKSSTPLNLNFRSATTQTPVGLSFAFPTTTPTTATTITTTTITTTITTTTTTTTSTTTTTTTTTTITSPHHKLSSSDLLKMCFESGIGCDFSQNEVTYELYDSTEVTTTEATTTTERPTPSLSVQQKLKKRVMLCFFRGLCGDDATGGVTTTPRLPPSSTRPTAPPTTARSQSRRDQISSSIKERARACFFQGVC